MMPDTTQPTRTNRRREEPAENPDRTADELDEPAGEIMVECRVATRRRRLDVEWTNGAVFCFPSREHARRWTAVQSASVPGQFSLEEPDGACSPLPVDLVVTYEPRAPDEY